MKEQLVQSAGCWYISGVDCAGTTEDEMNASRLACVLAFNGRVVPALRTQTRRLFSSSRTT